MERTAARAALFEMFADLAKVRDGRSLDEMIADPAFMKAVVEFRIKVQPIVQAAGDESFMRDVEQAGHFTALEMFELLEVSQDAYLNQIDAAA